MNITTLIKEAMNSITSNKVRSFLTMLGIFIGVGAVIAMMSVGQGAQNSITDSLSTLGTQTLYLTPGNYTENVRNAQNLTNDDVEAISRLDCVDIAAPVVSSQSYTISQSNGKTANATVTGVVPGYRTVGNYELQLGSFITQDNNDNKEMVAVIGTEINESLFGAKNSSSVGETIRIMGQPYRVIGVLEEKGSSTMGTSQDRNVFIPLSTAQSRLMTRQKNTVSQVSILIKSEYTLEDAQKQIESLLQERHGIFEGNPNDFTVMNVQEILNAVSTIMSTFTLFLGGVAAISLLVGGNGIMNVMLVTVSERTREIGLRKALGAKKGDILAQFLFRGEDIDKRVSVLSGGERARLGMAKLMLQSHNLLALDEPTNHMDIKSKDILKQALKAYDGTLVIVSHDRDFLDGLVDKLYEFRDGQVREFLGGVSDFLAKRRLESLQELERSFAGGSSNSSLRPSGKPDPSRKRVPPVTATGGYDCEMGSTPSGVRESYEQMRTRSKEEKKRRNRVEYLEKEIEKLEARMKAIEAVLSAPKDDDDIMELTREYLECKRDLDAKTDEWCELID